MGPHQQLSVRRIAVFLRVPRAIHSLCASLVERRNDSLVVRTTDLRLDLVAGASRGVPAHRQVRIGVRLERPSRNGPFIRATDIESFTTGQEHGVRMVNGPAVGDRGTDGAGAACPLACPPLLAPLLDLGDAVRAVGAPLLGQDLGVLAMQERNGSARQVGHVDRTGVRV